MTAMERRQVKVFLSFASDDTSVAEDLWRHLGQALATSGTLDWQFWKFTKQLLISENFHEEIQHAISDAHLGLFAISPAFLNSPYIQEHELARLRGIGNGKRGKRIAPFILKRVPDFADLKGLESSQIFGYPDGYWARRSPYERANWANKLADDLHRMADRYELGG